MTKRALVMGSAVGGLSGVSHDVKAMGRWLGELGFALDVREGPDATRDGMLEGLERLARDTQRGEAAVVYYSGHGGHVPVPPKVRFAGSRVGPRAFQYLVPTDHDKHGSFRGIFRAELSSFMRDLCDRTSNITVILDCCHSTDAIRDSDVVLKAMVEPWGEDVQAHVDWLVAQGYDLDRLPELRNASMVLLSACAATRQAYEYARPADGVRCGLFTDGLLDVVREVADPTQVTWDAIIRRVVDRVQRARWYQRPQVSGPSSRYLFSERQRRQVGALTLEDRAGHWCLSAGAAAGVEHGDRYHIVGLSTEDAPPPIAEVVVSQVEGHTAMVTIVSSDAERIEPGLMALPRPGGHTHQRCCIVGEGPLAEELQSRLGEVEGLELVEQADRRGLAFVLEVKGTELNVFDGDGAGRLRWPWRDVPELDRSTRRERIDGVLEDLRGLVRASDLLDLARRSSGVEDPPSLAHALEWGLVENGIARSLPSHGAELTVGERIYLGIENRGMRPLHVSVLDVGVGRAVTLLTRTEPEGIDLGVGETEILGAPELRTLQGLELRWPEETPPDGAREESLVIFISSGPLPVSSWETGSWHDRTAAGTRDMEPGAPTRGGPVYAIRHLSFRLHPRPHDQRS